MHDGILSAGIKMEVVDLDLQDHLAFSTQKKQHSTSLFYADLGRPRGVTHSKRALVHKPNRCSLIDNYFRQKIPCSIRKLTADFLSKSEVFSRFSWLLNFGAKMEELPLSVPQILWSQKRVVVQIQLLNILVTECKYYCLHLVSKFGGVGSPNLMISKTSRCSNSVVEYSCNRM